MVKRKWLWGKRSSEKMGGESESLASVSSQSEKCSEDQGPSKGSLGNTQSLEVTSKEDNETNGEVTNESLGNLAQKLSDASMEDGSQVSLQQEDESNISVDKSTQKLSDCLVNGGATDGLLKENASKVPVDKDTEPEKGVKTSNDCKEDTTSVKLLMEKLTAALVNVSLKDDLVKQHAKVAEEAVAGWEKAEKEASTMKQQLESAVKQKLAVEARANHLDEALKECVRQLRLARDGQERKINQAVAEKTNELELAKTKLQDQLIELQAVVEKSRVNSPDPDLQHKLENLERENISLRKELQAQSEELEVRTIERDLSTKAAETASKQHLESIKKVAKLEAECRKLKSLSRVSSAAATSSYVESLTDSQSDSGEQLGTSDADSRKMNCLGSLLCNANRSESWASALIAELDQFKSEKAVDRSTHASPIKVDLMDDFLEMERLAALPDGGHQASEKPAPETESKLRIELESAINQTAELEEKMEKVEAEKAELAMALVQTQSCLEKSQVQLIETQMTLEKLGKELWGANDGEEFYKAKAISLEKEVQLMCSKLKSLTIEVDRQRTLSETKSARCKELENELEKKKKGLEMQQDTICKELKMKEIALGETRECLETSLGQLMEADAKLRELEKELEATSEEKKSLKSQLDKERALSVAKSARCKELHNELKKKKKELETQRDAICNGELKMKEMALAETQQCLEKSQGRLRDAEAKLGELKKALEVTSEEKKSLESQLDREQAFSAAKSARCDELQNELEIKKKELETQGDAICNGELKMKDKELAETRECLDKSQGQLREAETKLGELEQELNAANEEKKSLKLQLDNIQMEVKAMSTQIDSLKAQVHKERALATELSTKFMELENDLHRKRRELEVQQRANSNEIKIKQEDLEVAVGKLADCQKTIASLGTQLKSLATLEDFLIDTAGIPGFSPPAPLMARRSTEPWKLHSNHTFLPQKEQEAHSPFMGQNGRHAVARESPASSSSSTSPAFFMNPPGSEKNANGFAKYFALTRD